MDRPYSIKVSDGITVVEFIGNIDFPTSQEVIDEIAKHRESSLRLYDFSCGGHFALNPAEIRELAEFGKRAAFASTDRVAIVAPEDLDFGLLRMYRVYRDSGQDRETHRVFRSIDDGMHWLKGEGNAISQSSLQRDDSARS